MSAKEGTRNLLIIAAFDSLCYGMVYSFLSPYILVLGGDHLTTALLQIGLLLGEIASHDVMEIFIHSQGIKFSLFFSLNVAMVTHLMLILTSNCYFTILARILFSVTNQSQNLCRSLILSNAQNQEDNNILQSVYSVLNGAGYILGPIISGYFFDSGFMYTCLLASFITLVNISLLLKTNISAQKEDKKSAPKSALEKAADKVLETCYDCQKSDCRENWDILALKYLFSASITVFFSKFSQLLKHNYKASSVVIGYTISYINAFVFLATYYAGSFRKSPLKLVSEMAFFILAVLLLFACYSPYYILFLTFLVPIIFARTFIANIWSDLFAERKNDSLQKLNNPTSLCAGITVPIFFGTLCNNIGHHAVILFSCLPVLTCWLIMRMSSRKTSSKPKES